MYLFFSICTRTNGQIWKLCEKYFSYSLSQVNEYDHTRTNLLIVKHEEVRTASTSTTVKLTSKVTICFFFYVISTRQLGHYRQIFVVTLRVYYENSPYNEKLKLYILNNVMLHVENYFLNGIIKTTHLYIFAEKIIGEYVYCREIPDFAEFEHQFNIFLRKRFITPSDPSIT